MSYILALQTDSGRLYWGGERDIGNDQGYRWQENPHQACCFRELIEADEYRRAIGHDSALIVDHADEAANWRNSYARHTTLMECAGEHWHSSSLLLAIASYLPTDIVDRIATRFGAKGSRT